MRKDLEVFLQLMRQSEADRVGLAAIQPMSPEMINVGLQKIPAFEKGILDLSRDVEQTRIELHDISIPRTRLWCTNENLLPLATTAQYIREAIGANVRVLADSLKSEREYEKAIIAYDMAYGVNGVVTGSMSAIPFGFERGRDESRGGVVTGVLANRGIVLPDAQQSRMMGDLLAEDALQLNYLTGDPSGKSLVDYWVKVVRELVVEEGWDRQPAMRVGEFVIAGAEMARKAYDLVYPQALAVVSSQ